MARCIALLSVLCCRSLGPEVMRPIDAAAAYWAAGDKALANLRLVFTGLPKLASPIDVHRLAAAAWCLDHGLAPGDLVRALELDSAVIDLRKYDPDQPRFPAGSGRESGRWTNESGAGATGGTAGLRPSNAVLTDDPNRFGPTILQVAADGPLKLGGIDIVPLQGVDPLDPQRMNGPLSLAEQQAIADTVNTILAKKPEDVSTLSPHPYNNYPNKETGAQLPPATGIYITSYVRPPGKPPGASRVIINQGGHIFYTRNHCRSFYPVDIQIKPEK